MSLRSLFDRAMARHRPEDVAEAILQHADDRLPNDVRAALSQAATHSLANLGWQYSSMTTDFFEAVVQVSPQARLAAKLFEVKPLTAKQTRDREAVLAFVSRCGELLGGLDRKLNKAGRRAIGIHKGHRWYNKRRRLLLRLGAKIERQAWNDKRNSLRRASKTALMSRLTYDDFARDRLTAYFVTYYAARMGMRSTFTNTSQVRAYDEISEVLLRKLRGREDTAWFAVAHVLPDRDVVARLMEEERGRLMGAAYEQLMDAAHVLETTWREGAVDRSTMIVRRGFDSSTWNESAGAWNRLRESWISLMHALGMEGVLERQLPGKVMRVMAADVAAWHRASGGDVHPDTRVWAMLPLPWQVLRGEVDCSRQDVHQAVVYAHAKPEGWLGPRIERRRAEAFTPTPELVHGVAVSSPALAHAMRRAGVFSGKRIRHQPPPTRILRDENGFAIGAEPLATHEKET